VAFLNYTSCLIQDGKAKGGKRKRTAQRWVACETLCSSPPRNLQLSGVDDGDLGLWCSRSASDALDGLDDIITLQDLAEDDVASVQPRGLDGGDEELGSVGVWPGVGHGEVHWSLVLEVEVLISELLSIDRFSSTSVEHGEVTSLDHCGDEISMQQSGMK